MAHLYKKVKNGRDYYYIRETQRVYGKPTTINQVYLGTADKARALLGEGNEGGFSPKEFGSVFVLHELDRGLNLARLVDAILPAKKRVRGPSLGELIFYAAMNRAISPTSKRQLASWYETTDIQRIRPLRQESLSSQNFWNHYDRIGEAELEKMVTAFFRKVHTLLPPQDEPLLLEVANLAPSLRSPTSAEAEGRDPFPPLPSPQMGLALITGQATGVPRYFRIFPGGLPGSGVLNGYVDGLLAPLARLGVDARDLTVIFNQDIDSQALARLDAAGFHFIAPSANLAAEAARVPLKDFRPLPGMPGRMAAERPEDEDPVLYFESRVPLGGRQRRLLITFDPRRFQKSYQDLRKKVQKVQRELTALARQSPGKAGEDFATHLAQVCQRLDLSPSLFQLKLPRPEGRPALAWQLDHHQVQEAVRRLGKTVLITDREDWPAREIYQVYTQRLVLKTLGPNGNRAAETRHPFNLPLTPLYHWTNSKIRVHFFVCIIALTYLALLGQRLRAAGLEISPREAIEEMRALCTAIYVTKPEGKLRRALDKVSDSQLAILRALGFQVQDGKILPL